MPVRKRCCIICYADTDDQVLCEKCLDKLDLKKSAYNALEQEYHLVWKSIVDRTKYPSVLRDCDITYMRKRYNKDSETIYAKTDSEISNNIIERTKRLVSSEGFI